MKSFVTLLLPVLLFLGPVSCNKHEGGGEAGKDAAVIATVGETKIMEAEKNDLGGRVLGLLLDEYAAERKLEASDEEIDRFLTRLAEGEKAEGMPDSVEESLTESEKKELAEFRDGMARSIIKAWKVNKALFDEYGGRVIYQQGGPEPLDAYRKFLEDRMQAGAFALSDKQYEADLWREYTQDELHDFVPDDQRATLLQTPPWNRQEQEESTP